MSRKCELTGQGPRVGNRISHAHNVSKRRFNINLQRVRVLIDSKPQHIRVSARALRSGLIERPSIRIRQRAAKLAETPVADSARAEAVEEEPISEFFSEASVVSRLFKPKPKPAEEIEESAAEMTAEEENGTTEPESGAAVNAS